MISEIIKENELTLPTITRLKTQGLTQCKGGWILLCARDNCWTKNYINFLKVCMNTKWGEGRVSQFLGLWGPVM